MRELQWGVRLADDEGDGTVVRCSSRELAETLVSLGNNHSSFLARGPRLVLVCRETETRPLQPWGVPDAL
jgi:hypothetical protein